MQALSEEPRSERLEMKVDDGFAEMRDEFKAVEAEAHANFRTLVAITSTMLTAIILGFGGMVVATLSHG